MRKQKVPVIERLLAKVEVNENGCWIWTGGNTRGYGQISGDHGAPKYTHRLSYEYFIGEIPEGLFLDHLCRTPACCNPGHLEPVTAAENNRRGQGCNATNRAKTHCHRGHEFTPENTRMHRGRRNCRTCQKMLKYEWELQGKRHKTQ